MTETEIRQDLGRAKNAIQDYLIRKLVVPKIYLDANWNGTQVDVLAIDRAGVGDVHAVRIAHQGEVDSIEEVTMRNVLGAIAASGQVYDSEIESMSLQSHYRYVAVVSENPDARKFKPTEVTIKQTLADDGVGRVGILYVDLCEDDPKLQVRVILKAERFRSSKEIVELADRYVAEHTANWEIRE
jgi:hypothetical protein